MNKRQALKIYRNAQKNPSVLYKEASNLRKQYFGSRVKLCSIINAKSGNCGENCAFCAQSRRYGAKIAEYPLVSSEAMVDSARKAAGIKAYAFGIVTSGDCVDGAKELPQICEAVNRIKKEGVVKPHASLGRLTKEKARRLKDAGLERYHHNLETSKDFFPNICTTHSYQDRIDTVRIAKEAGFEVCSGGIFGLGEDIKHRIDFAFTLKELDVDSVPLNFLIPIRQTPLEDAKPLSADEILMTIAMFRIIMPDKHIKVCGGREVNLGPRQREIFYAGASGMMIGGYLTQGGNPPERDLKMLEELGLAPEVARAPVPPRAGRCGVPRGST